MSRLTNWLLIPPVSSRLSERYRHYRHHGASSLSAALFVDDSGVDVHPPRTSPQATHSCAPR
ncbi:cellulose synthase catalytic subunit [UDP-forming] [Enterobacter sp. MGH 1]|nr:cellulose synthase catalytic subunit [UDP-forming] [Enterobacter sp. MGH 6]EUN01097.1 cellulose synthase catalytic subunit [UDP-forming] [Enterobacter sp. MGH 1]